MDEVSVRIDDEQQFEDIPESGKFNGPSVAYVSKSWFYVMGSVTTLFAILLPAAFTWHEQMTLDSWRVKSNLREDVGLEVTNVCV